MYQIIDFCENAIKFCNIVSLCLLDPDPEWTDSARLKTIEWYYMDLLQSIKSFHDRFIKKNK